MHLLVAFVLLADLCLCVDKKPDDLEQLKSKGTALVVAALDNVVENRWEIWSLITGKETPEASKKKDTKEAVEFVEELAKDMAVGHAVRSTWQTVWNPILASFAIVCLVFILRKTCFRYPRY